MVRCSFPLHPQSQAWKGYLNMLNLYIKWCLVWRGLWLIIFYVPSNDLPSVLCGLGDSMFSGLKVVRKSRCFLCLSWLLVVEIRLHTFWLIGFSKVKQSTEKDATLSEICHRQLVEWKSSSRLTLVNCIMSCPVLTLLADIGGDLTSNSELADGLGWKNKHWVKFDHVAH